MVYELTDHFEIAADIDRCWQFFATADNLPLITPPWLNFRITGGGGVAISDGTLLDYTIRWLGIPVKWRTKIIDWSPPRQFIDLQLRGPYALWLHRHTFAPSPAGGTDCRDTVVYRLPVPVAGRVVHRGIVRRQLLEIFRFRRKVIGDRLGGFRAVQRDVEIRALS